MINEKSMNEKAMVEKKRALRINEWMSVFGEYIWYASGLIDDLLRLVGDYAVSLAHEWAPIPTHLRENGVCGCINDSSPTFKSCYCWKLLLQHACSIYTLSECDTNTFRINFTAKSWWIGVIWPASNIHAIQPSYEAMVNSVDRDSFGCFDSQSAVEALYISSSGGGLWHHNRGGAKFLSHVNTTWVDRIDINVKNNQITLALFFESERRHWCSFSIQSLNFDHLRPFVQLKRSALRDPQSLAIIETPIFEIPIPP